METAMSISRHSHEFKIDSLNEELIEYMADHNIKLISVEPLHTGLYVTVKGLANNISKLKQVLLDRF
ncbi:hypothetical protein KNT64_gp212 [Pseudomonas phage PspYZU05]|uniref:Uncharacterized protein n=1 Tax=Pseudomonas phage PspYZU05 TaxID=1983556 RepID=A0A2U7NJN3_9CAUD|nr:hypothetical protein KNT64_gp212 [Pseudomonas phage PspYZU05]ASD52164.1 hypothetical protein PspYZU05_212 [Pseudomonas phage PspYZU05]